MSRQVQGRDQPPARARVERKRPVVRRGDPLDDREAETDAPVVVVQPCGAASERLGSVATRSRSRRSPVFSTTRATPDEVVRVVTHAPPPDGTLCTIALCSRFVVSWSRSAREADVAAASPAVVDRDAALLGEREQHLGRLLREERQVDGLSRAKLRWSARLSTSSASVRSMARVLTRAQPLDEQVDVRVGVLRGHVEQRLRDRERRTQLVRGVRRETLLLGDVALEPLEHGVEGVGQLAELVVAAGQQRCGGRARRCRGAGGRGDPVERGEHPAGEDPAADQPDDEEQAAASARPWVRRRSRGRSGPA